MWSEGPYMLLYCPSQVLTASLAIGPHALGALAHVITTVGASSLSDAQAAPQTNHIGIAEEV